MQAAPSEGSEGVQTSGGTRLALHQSMAPKRRGGGSDSDSDSHSGESAQYSEYSDYRADDNNHHRDGMGNGNGIGDGDGNHINDDSTTTTSSSEDEEMVAVEEEAAVAWEGALTAVQQQEAQLQQPERAQFSIAVTPCTYVDIEGEIDGGASVRVARDDKGIPPPLVAPPELLVGVTAQNQPTFHWSECIEICKEPAPICTGNGLIDIGNYQPVRRFDGEVAHGKPYCNEVLHPTLRQWLSISIYQSAGQTTPMYVMTHTTGQCFVVAL